MTLRVESAVAALDTGIKGDIIKDSDGTNSIRITEDDLAYGRKPQGFSSEDGAECKIKVLPKDRLNAVYDTAEYGGVSSEETHKDARTFSKEAIPKKPLYYRVIKRAFDIVFSICVIVVGFVPSLILCAVISADTKGSPIYSSTRVGRAGRLFRILKFRTMVADADDLEKHLNAEQLEQWHKEHKIDNDPRITKLGRLLRSSSIDEFPQFLNVLVGQIPSRILKMRQVFSEKKPGAFALPATEVRTNKAVFPQVKDLSKAGLRTLRRVPSHSIASFGTTSHFFAKRVFRAFEGRLNSLCEVVTVA